MDISHLEKRFRAMQLAALEKGGPVPQIGGGQYGSKPPSADEIRHILARSAAFGLCAPPKLDGYFADLEKEMQSFEL